MFRLLHTLYGRPLLRACGPGFFFRFGQTVIGYAVVEHQPMILIGEAK